MFRFRNTLLAAGVALVVAWATPASADTILFNPNGTGAVGAIEVDSMDQAVGNAMATNITVASPIGTDFTLYYQSNLAQMFEAGNPDPVFEQGDGGNFFTFAAAFGETLTGAVPNFPSAGNLTLGFGLDATPTGGLNFFNMYDASAAGDNLDGTGFDTGLLILSGHAVSTGFISSFTFQSLNPASAVDFDQHGDNNYPNIDTLVGSGVANIQIAIDFVNPLYFPAIAPGTIITFAITNTTLALPFLTVDPSACFHATLVGGCAGGIAGASTVGTLNAVTGPNTMLQADASTSFVTRQVPEPGLLTLFGLGLVGVAARFRARRA